MPTVHRTARGWRQLSSSTSESALFAPARSSSIAASACETRLLYGEMEAARKACGVESG